MNNVVFGKTMENLRKQRDIKLIAKKTRKNYFLSEPIYHTIRSFKENVLEIEMKKRRCL